MELPPLALVVNPTAGGGKPARYLPAVAAVLDAAGASYRVQESTSLEHARTLARQAARRGETVVAFGGDGLTGSITDAIAGAESGHQDLVRGRSCTLGVIPAGRGNDFARTHGIPFEPAAAARVLLDGRPRPVDLIAVAGSAPQATPTMVAGSVYVGIASVAGEIANRTRLIRGPAVYKLAALRALLSWRPTTFQLETTGADERLTSAEFRGYAVVVANNPYFGAGMKVAPGASADDGMLDIVLMRHAPKLTFVRALAKIKDGSHVALPQVVTLRVKSATVRVSRQLPVGADGDFLPFGPPLRVHAVPAALQVIAPA